MQQDPTDPYYNRRTKGTRLYALRHRIVLSILAASGLFATAYHFLPSSRAFSKTFIEWAKKDNEFVQERRMLLSNTLMSSSSEKIKKDLEESEEKCI